MTIETLTHILLTLAAGAIGLRLGYRLGCRHGAADVAGGAGVSIESWRAGHEAGLRNAGIIHRTKQEA